MRHHIQILTLATCGYENDCTGLVVVQRPLSEFQCMAMLRMSSIAQTFRFPLSPSLSEQ
jgi:hypothetical protein